MKTESVLVKRHKRKHCYTRNEISNFSQIFYNILLVNNVYRLTKESMSLASDARHLYYNINPPAFSHKALEEWLEDNSVHIINVRHRLPEKLKTLEFEATYSIKAYNDAVDYINSVDSFSWDKLSRALVNPINTIYEKDFTGRAENGFGEADIKNAGSHLAWLFAKRAAMGITEFADTSYQHQLRAFSLGWLTFLKPIALTSEELRLQTQALNNTADMLHDISF